MTEGNVGEPASFAGLQHDPRGFPIPVHVGRPPNKPVNITAYDRFRLILITAQRRCTICGWKIPTEELCWYISSPEQIAELNKPGGAKWDKSTEGVGHKECMVYAAVACPWLSAGPGYKRKTPQRDGKVLVMDRGTERGDLLLVGLPRALIKITTQDEMTVIVGGGIPEIVPFERGADLMPILVDLLNLSPRSSDADDGAFVELLSADDETSNIKVLATQTMLELAVQIGQPIRTVERNERCPCMSGQKAKHCCLPRIDGIRDRLRSGETFEERLAVFSQ